jgi:hypothetical protein
MNNEIKRQQSAEDKQRRAAIAQDRNTIPMDFSTGPKPEHDPSDPLWKRVWKTEGIRYLGRNGNGVIDAMERFERAFMLGYRAGVSDMLGELQGEKE